jgi:hypothetical protein
MVVVQSTSRSAGRPKCEFPSLCGALCGLARTCILLIFCFADRSADVDGEDEAERGGAQKEEGADGQNPERT